MHGASHTKDTFIMNALGALLCEDGPQQASVERCLGHHPLLSLSGTSSCP